MAHFAKHTRGSVGGLTKHFERAKDNEGRYYRFKNQSIDKERTSLNYNLATHGESQLNFIKNRLNEVYCMKRDDVKVMGTWVVTAPQTVPSEHQREFFERTYKFLAERYGEKNVVSAYVHMDETTPHMHFAFIPITYDKKKEREKVSAKEVINKADMRTFHTDLQKVMDEFTETHDNKFKCDVLNGATENGNITVQGLKARELEQLNAEQELALEEQIDMYNTIGVRAQQLERDTMDFYMESEKLKDDIEKLKEVKTTLAKEIDVLEDKMDNIMVSEKMLWARFLRLPKIKESYQNFCEKVRKANEEKKALRHERGVGTMEDYEKIIEKIKNTKNNRTSSPTPKKNDIER